MPLAGIQTRDPSARCPLHHTGERRTELRPRGLQCGHRHGLSTVATKGEGRATGSGAELAAGPARGLRTLHSEEQGPALCPGPEPGGGLENSPWRCPCRCTGPAGPGGGGRPWPCAGGPMVSQVRVPAGPRGGPGAGRGDRVQWPPEQGPPPQPAQHGARSKVTLGPAGVSAPRQVQGTRPRPCAQGGGEDALEKPRHALRAELGPTPWFHMQSEPRGDPAAGVGATHEPRGRSS